MKKLSLKDLKLTANTLRQDIINMLLESGSGHSAGPLGMADIFSALYFNILDIDAKNPWKDNRDYLILSAGHLCPVLYASLARSGFFPVEKLKDLRKLDSGLEGHPHYKALPGIENSSGPLGQGISVAAGIALGLKSNTSKNYVYCIVSDGEANEGQFWEALMFAAKYKLDNLIIIMDRNKIQIDGFTEDIMPLEPLNAKLMSFNLHVHEIDGHNIAQFLKAIEIAKQNKDKPHIIIADTIPGKGVSFMENKPGWHGKAPNEEETKKALEELEKIRALIE